MSYNPTKEHPINGYTDRRTRIICNNDKLVEVWKKYTIDSHFTSTIDKHSGDSISFIPLNPTIEEIAFTWDKANNTYTYIPNSIKPYRDFVENIGQSYVDTLVGVYADLTLLPEGSTASKQADLIGKIMRDSIVYNADPNWMVERITPTINFKFNTTDITKKIPANVIAFEDPSKSDLVPEIAKGNRLDAIVSFIDRLHPNTSVELELDFLERLDKKVTLLEVQNKDLCNANSQDQEMAIRRRTNSELAKLDIQLAPIETKVRTFLRETNLETHSIDIHNTNGTISTILLANVLDDIGRVNKNIEDGKETDYNKNIVRPLLHYLLEEILLSDEGHILKALVKYYDPGINEEYLNAFVKQYIPTLDPNFTKHQSTRAKK